MLTTVLVFTLLTIVTIFLICQLIVGEVEDYRRQKQLDAGIYELTETRPDFWELT